MKKRLALITVIIFAVFSFAYHQTRVRSERFDLPAKQSQIYPEIKAQNVRAVAFGVSAKVSDLAPASPGEGQRGKKSADEQAESVPNKIPFRKQIQNAAPDSDPALASVSAVPMPSPSLSFDGLSNSDNAAAYGTRVVPPDANGDVGPNHYVQSVNILTRVYDKSGNALTPPFKLSSIFSTLGTVCSQRNDGDPIVLYDALADRWILSQFCNNFPPFRQLVAVSKTADPTGAYYVYEFVMPNVKFNDYPKLGVWTNGYYMSTDEFLGSDYAGSGVFAFDKKKMLAGDSSASYIYFDLASPTTIRIGGLLPSDFDGLNAPPADTPNTFVGFQATEYGDPTDALRLFDFYADFTNPGNSTFSERAESPLAVAAFDPTSPEGRTDVSQPATDERLDAQSDRLMYRAAYRNFGTHQSLVVNQTVRVSPVGQAYRGGVRIHELRKTTANYAVHEQATFGTNDVSRWLGSAAQDYQGNLAFGYSTSGENKNPSIFYSGKLASEPAGTFRQESVLINGTGVQTAFGSRWGDYSSISVDPGDDCTFWLTNEYYTAESQAENPFGWLTRIGRFKFDECTSTPRSVITGTVTNAATGQPILDDSVIVTANTVYSRAANESGSYGNLTLLPGTYTLTATARGFRSQTVTVTVANGQTLMQNFALQPTALFANASVNFTAESCAANNAVDPSETVTINLVLSNSGAGNTTNLVATLLATGGVVNPSQPQNYGAMTGGMSVLRPFTFTASTDLDCGERIILTFQLQDGAENLGAVTVELNTGKQRVAFQETFGATGEPNLPAGWTTSATGAQAVWKTTMMQHQTPPLAAYSAAAAQPGVNEMTSPVFRVNSTTAELTFRNRYDLETTFLRNKLYDGGVLEIKIGNGFFQDILAAGGVFTSGGYDGVLDGCCQNPLAGRRAWSGKSGPNQTPQFITSKVKLPARAADKNIRLRWRVGTDNGTSREGQYIDDILVSDGYECACQIAQATRSPFDFDGDGRTDLSFFITRLSPTTPNFAVRRSSDNVQVNTNWGDVGHEPVNADYDGDGKTDYAVFRAATGTWFILQSSDNTYLPINFGRANDARVPADYDGDGKADIAVYRSGLGFWYVRQSSDAQMRSTQFGAAGDIPVSADYDADGKTDFAVFRPASGTWFTLQSSDGAVKAVRFGQDGDVPVTGDYDADGKADFVVYRQSSGTWYLQKTAQGLSAFQFGASGDNLLQADFDGDGKRDIAVYRPSNGVWYYLRSSDGAFISRRFSDDVISPPPIDFISLPSIFIRGSN